MTVANPLPETPVSALTQASIDGTGVFDALMRATKVHLEQEFNKNRIKGPEFATVYLGALQSTMQTALAFMAQAKKQELEAMLLEKQVALADVQLQQGQAQLLQIQAQTAQIEKQTLAVDTQILQTQAQTALVEQQKTNLAAEALNIPKQGLLVDAQAAVQTQQQLNLESQKLQIEAESALTTQKTTNAVTENTVLVATECKLKAEFDVLMETKLKTATETTLLAQKTATEKAQITALGVDDNSILGKQKALYAAQTDGFKRDAEQKAAKLMVDTWNVRRTTDEGTVADATNMLNDAAVGRAVTKLLVGVGA